MNPQTRFQLHRAGPRLGSESALLTMRLLLLAGPCAYEHQFRSLAPPTLGSDTPARRFAY
jgi:hypothetical protein